MITRRKATPRHVVCYSGGHSSAVAAIEVVRRFGRENVTLLNHDMHFSVEDADIKRFKQEVADYLGLPITFASRRDATQDQFDVCVEAGAFKIDSGSELCTSRLKTEPFMAWLQARHAGLDYICYYGFDPSEKVRIQRRVGIMAAQGFRTDFPIALWKERTIQKTEEIGIAAPSTYSVFKHGNCIGCLKAGWQHWYIVYCTRPDLWLKGKWAEEEIGYAIHHDDSGPVFLADMEDRFEQMQMAGVEATERVKPQTWWASARKIVRIYQTKEVTPCDCSHP